MKLMGGPAELPAPFLRYIEANHAEYLTAPSDWNGFEVTSAAENFRQIIEARKAAGNN